jgi:squalene-associated FAD-dependent desaturase
MEKIIIVGAGVAGISAAMQLCDAGCEVEIFEQKMQVGGRITAIHDIASGDTIDNGQHLLTGAYTRFLEILEQLGTSKGVTAQKSLKIPFFSKSGNSTLDTSILPGSLGLLAGLLLMRKIKLSSKIRALNLMVKIKFGLQDVDSDCLEFLLKHDQNKDMIDFFWEPLVLATINAPLNQAPAKLMINVLKKAFLADRKSSVLIFPAIDLASLVEPFGKDIESRGGKLHLGKKVVRIIFENNTFRGVELSDGSVRKADSAVLAIPEYSFTKLIPDEYLSKLKNHSFEHSPILSVYYWFDKDYFDFDFAGIVGYKSQWIFNRRRIIKFQSGKFAGHITVTVSAADELLKLSQDETAKLIFEELKDVLNLNDSIQPIRHRVIIEKFATPLITVESEKRRPKEKTQIKGLYLAGDWCDTGLPATIEGAAISGKKAADEIINSRS